MAQMAFAFQKLKIKFEAPSDQPPDDATPDKSTELEYGTVTESVRSALGALPDTPRGIDAGSVLAQIKRVDPSSEITALQVRSALKTLFRQNELTRVKRGFYRLKPNPDNDPAPSSDDGDDGGTSDESGSRHPHEANGHNREAGRDMFSGTA